MSTIIKKCISFCQLIYKWAMNKQKLFKYRTYAKKPGQDSKSLFLTHKYLPETWFAEFAWVSPDFTCLRSLLC